MQFTTDAIFTVRVLKSRTHAVQKEAVIPKSLPGLNAHRKTYTSTYLFKLEFSLKTTKAQQKVHKQYVTVACLDLQCAYDSPSEINLQLIYFFS